MPVPPPAVPPPPGTQYSAINFVEAALRLLNVLASGEHCSGSEGADGVAVLNQMIDEWNAEGLMIFTTLISDFPFVGGQQVYTLGTGGNFNIPRPAEIVRGSVILNPNVAASALEIPIAMYTDQDWQKVSLKGTDTTFPLSFYDDGAYPFRNLSFWPIPRDAATNFRLYSWSPLRQFPDLATVLTFPPAYYAAIRYNLAVRLAPEFNAVLRQEVAAIAANAISKIKVMNHSEENLICDLGVAPGTASRKVRNELFGIP